MRIATLSCLLGLVAAPALADMPNKPRWEPAIPAAKDFDLTNTILDFPSGLRIIIQEDHSHPIAGVFTYVGHGNNDDPVGAEETAHFVEHLWFRSVHGELPPIMWTIQDMGTLFNATTAPDRTDYRTVAGIQYLPLLLKFESLRLTNFYEGVTEEQIDTEREVIRNEWRRRNEQNMALLFDYVGESVFPEGHPYARYSTHETIDNINLKVLQTYVDTYYKTEDTTITIVGDFKTDDVVGMIFETFEPSLFHPDLTEEFMSRIPAPGIAIDDLDPENPAHWAGWLPLDPSDETKQTALEFKYDASRPPRVTAENRQEPPPVGKKEIVRKKAPVDETVVAVGWSLPAGYHPDHFNLVLLGNVVSAVVNSGVRQAYSDVDNNKIGDGSGCFVQTGLHASTLMCLMEIKDKRINVDGVGEKIMDQISLLWNSGYDGSREGEQRDPFEPWFRQGKQGYLLNLVGGMDTIAASFGSRAEQIGEYAHWTGDTSYYSRAMENVMTIEPLVVKEMAQKYVRRDRAAVVIVEPLGDDEADVESDSSSYAGVSDGDAVIEASDNMELATPQEIARSWVRPALNGLVDQKLKNGLRVVILPHGDAPKVNVQLVMGGGNSSDAHGLHSFVNSFSETEYIDAAPIAGFTNWFRRSLGFSTGANNFTFSFTGFSGNLPHGLWLLRQRMEAAKPDMAGKKTYMSRLENRLKGNWSDAGWHMQKVRYDHLYPGSDAYRMMDWNDVQMHAEWGADDVRTYLDRVLQPENATLIVVGKVDPAAVLGEVEHFFGGFEAAKDAEVGPMPPLPTPAMPTETARTLIFDEENRTQTQTNMACRLNYQGPEDDQAVQVLGAMVGNQVFATLRVKEGLAYSPGGYARSSMDGSAFLGFSSLAVNRGVGRTVEFFRHAVERVEQGDIDLDEIKLHQIRINRQSGVGSQTVDQMGGSMRANVLRQREWKDYRKFGRNIAAVQAKDLTRLVEGCLDHAIITLQGPKDVVIAQLDEQGFEYEVLEYEDLGDKLLWEYDPKAAKKKQKAKDKADRKKEKEEGESDEDDSETADADE